MFNRYVDHESVPVVDLLVDCKDNEGNDVEINDVVQNYPILRQAHGNYGNCDGINNLFAKFKYFLFNVLKFSTCCQDEDVTTFGDIFGLL